MRATPDSVPLSLFVVIPDATFETMLPALQVVAVTVTPLNVIALDLCVVPKFDPAISMLDPTHPLFGLARATDGAWATSRFGSRRKKKIDVMMKAGATSSGAWAHPLRSRRRCIRNNDGSAARQLRRGDE
jgi:hypothetical protein